MSNITTYYPLVLDSSQPAFNADIEELKIYFSLPNILSETIFWNNTDNVTSLNKIYASIRNLKNNKSIYKNSENQVVDKFEVGCYKEDGKFYVKIFNETGDFWSLGELYSLQLQYQLKDENNTNLSEWSNISYLKATSKMENITCKILLNEIEENITDTNSPNFIGIYSNPNDLEEIESKYKFDLYLSDELKESSGWKTHINNIQDSFVFKTNLEENNFYDIKYSVITKNNFEISVTRRNIQYIPSEDIPNIKFDKISPDPKEGLIEITLQSSEPEKASFILRRTDSYSNFSLWEDYYTFSLENSESITLKDKLIESGVNYKYSVCKITNGRRSPFIESDNEGIHCDYEDIFLIGEDRQLKIKYNPKVSNYKRMIQESKTETIGSQFPFIRRNGLTNYFTFSLGGLISYKMDEKSLFYDFDNIFNSTTSLQRTKECNLERSSFHEAYDFNNNLTLDNIKYEKIFRDQVEEFLTNGKYKIFKSPIEGIRIISLTGVTLTPNDSLGRMLYSFSSTANEVIEYNLSNALKYNIISTEV